VTPQYCVKLGKQDLADLPSRSDGGSSDAVLAKHDASLPRVHCYLPEIVHGYGANRDAQSQSRGARFSNQA